MVTGKHILIALAILMLFAGCSTLSEEEPVIEAVSGYTYFNETRALLLEETDSRFWKAVNFYKSEFPEETERLLLEYSLFQKQLIRHYIGEENPYAARFHLNNLCSIPENEGSFFPKEKLHDEIILLYEKINSEAREQLFRTGISAPMENSDITAFNRSLAEVHIRYNWTNDDGIQRYNLDDMAGSGFLITPSHVLTAFHVVSNVFHGEISSYSISLKFGERIIEDIKILSWDSLTDLAVLEIPEPVSIPFLYNHLVESDEISQGDVIYTLGHPYGYSNTLSKGIVSSARRTAPEWGSWIQIDASVGPGSSGGLLFNENRQIIGLVVAGINGEEMNFAVPSSLIRRVIDPMINGFSIKRPWCGLLFDDESMNVKHIFEESPLSATEVRIGDRLIAVNDISVVSLESAKDQLDRLEAGNMISLTFTSGSGEIKSWIKVMRRPDFAISNKIERMDIPERILVSTGVELIEIRDSPEKISIDQNIYYFNSCTVGEIDKNSYLYSQGIRTGDRLGLMEDYFKDRKYHLTVLHIPSGKKISDLKDPRDMIFTIIKDKYNEFVF